MVAPGPASAETQIPDRSASSAQTRSRSHHCWRTAPEFRPPRESPAAFERSQKADTAPHPLRKTHPGFPRARPATARRSTPAPKLQSSARAAAVFSSPQPPHPLSPRKSDPRRNDRNHQGDANPQPKLTTRFIRQLELVGIIGKPGWIKIRKVPHSEKPVSCRRRHQETRKRPFRGQKTQHEHRPRNRRQLPSSPLLRFVPQKVQH